MLLPIFFSLIGMHQTRKKLLFPRKFLPLRTDFLHFCAHFQGTIIMHDIFHIKILVVAFRFSLSELFTSHFFLRHIMLYVGTYRSLFLKHFYFPSNLIPTVKRNIHTCFFTAYTRACTRVIYIFPPHSFLACDKAILARQPMETIVKRGTAS